MFWSGCHPDVGQNFWKRKLNKSSTFVKCYKLAPPGPPFMRVWAMALLLLLLCKSDSMGKSFSMNDTQIQWWFPKIDQSGSKSSKTYVVDGSLKVICWGIKWFFIDYYCFEIKFKNWSSLVSSHSQYNILETILKLR